jgi:CDP-diglyceride synthetase
MSRLNPFARNLLILAAVALAIVVLNQEIALATVGALLRIAFLIALAVAAYFMWRDFGRREIGLWPRRAQIVVYAAAGLFVADMGAWFLGSPSGRDALAFILVAAACAYAGYRTWREQRRLG